MNRILGAATSGGLLLAALLFPGPLFAQGAAVEDISVLRPGRPYRTIEVYRRQEQLYLSARDAASIFQAQLYWYGVSGRVELRFPDGTLRFKTASREMDTGDGRGLTLPAEVLARAGRAFIPLEAFLTPDFGALARVDAVYRPDQKMLVVRERSAAIPAPPLPPTAAPAAPPVAPARAERDSPVGASPSPREARRLLIVIDPGHGGKDPGARVGRGIVEKDIALKIAKDLAGFLSRERRFKVLLTRSSDVFIPLARRASDANDRHAALFVSIHCNAHRNKRERGFEVYFLSDKASDPWAQEVEATENASLHLEEGGRAEGPAAVLLHSLARMEDLNGGALLAGYIDKELRRRVDLHDRGVKQASFYVLRWTDSPSVLIETAFLTNTGDRSKLRNYRFRRKMAQAIYRGILAYAQAKRWKV